jgi:hypothetical protein
MHPALLRYSTCIARGNEIIQTTGNMIFKHGRMVNVGYRILNNHKSHMTTEYFNINLNHIRNAQAEVARLIPKHEKSKQNTGLMFKSLAIVLDHCWSHRHSTPPHKMKYSELVDTTRCMADRVDANNKELEYINEQMIEHNVYMFNLKHRLLHNIMNATQI